MIKALPLLVLTVLLSSCVTVPVEHHKQSHLSLTQQSVYKLFTHTVRLRASVKSSPNAEISGSATVIQKNETKHGWEYVIITASHVIEHPDGINEIFVEVDNRDADGWIVSKTRVGLNSRHIKRVSRLYDIAIIKFLLQEELQVAPADIADFKAVQNASPGSVIYGAGCSFGHPTLIHTGYITSKVRDIRAPISTWMVASINWDSGSSGGGVYNSSLELIGVISAEQGSGVGLYVPLTSFFIDQNRTTIVYDLINDYLSEVLSPDEIPTKL